MLIRFSMMFAKDNVPRVTHDKSSTYPASRQELRRICSHVIICVALTYYNNSTERRWLLGAGGLFLLGFSRVDYLCCGIFT